jgi:hypothetical protein
MEAQGIHQLLHQAKATTVVVEEQVGLEQIHLRLAEAVGPVPVELMPLSVVQAKAEMGYLVPYPVLPHIMVVGAEADKMPGFLVL